MTPQNPSVPLPPLPTKGLPPRCSRLHRNRRVPRRDRHPALAPRHRRNPPPRPRLLRRQGPEPLDPTRKGIPETWAQPARCRDLPTTRERSSVSLPRETLTTVLGSRDPEGECL